MAMSNEQMREKCERHARVAARSAVLKGLDRNTVGAWMLVEAVMLIFNIEKPEAAKVVEQAMPEMTKWAMIERLRREPGLLAECGELVPANMATFNGGQST